MSGAEVTGFWDGSGKESSGDVWLEWTELIWEDVQQ